MFRGWQETDDKEDMDESEEVIEVTEGSEEVVEATEGSEEAESEEDEGCGWK